MTQHLGLGSGSLQLWRTRRAASHKIDGKPLVRVTFPNGETEAIFGFETLAEAIKWIRCEAVVWLWQRREQRKRKEAN
jgi:hypothetical protein